MKRTIYESYDRPFMRYNERPPIYKRDLGNGLGFSVFFIPFAFVVLCLGCYYVTGEWPWSFIGR